MQGEPAGPVVRSAPDVIDDAAATATANVAGASADREYRRRSQREQVRKAKIVADDAAWRVRVREERPILGRLATAMTAKPVAGPESQSTRAWASGALGEREVARVLDSATEITVLHDRRIPGSKGNIDHIAVGAAGVFVIDAKHYAGRVERRDVGGWLRTDERLYVNNRDRTKLLDGLDRQVEVVRGVLMTANPTVPVLGGLCFVDADQRRSRKPVRVRGASVMRLGSLTAWVRQPGDIDSAVAARIVAVLDEVLPPA